MAAADSHSSQRKRPPSAGFRISNGAVIPHGKADLVSAFAELGELPKHYGAPILFAIARDPHTIFACWNIDWSHVFARNVPIDRQVYLRVKRSDGSDEIEHPVEPMLGSYYALVTQPRATYHVELGFYQPDSVWNSIVVSDPVTMPPDTASEKQEIDVATIPFHLSFQRMIDLFRASSGDAVAVVLAHLQGRASEPEDETVLSAEEWAILEQMDLSMADVRAGRQAFLAQDNDGLRKRVEAVLGFGRTGSSGEVGGSSRSFGGS